MFLNSTGGGTKFADFGISAGILSALVIASGITQAGLVLSKPIPEFATGVVGFRGKGTTTSDSNLAYISNGESVITERGTRTAAEALKAINNNEWDDYKHESIVLPALLAFDKHIARERSREAYFDDTGLRRDIQRNRTIELGTQTVTAIANAIPRNRKGFPNG